MKTINGKLNEDNPFLKQLRVSKNNCETIISYFDPNDSTGKSVVLNNKSNCRENLKEPGKYPIVLKGIREEISITKDRVILGKQGSSQIEHGYKNAGNYFLYAFNTLLARA
jgi:hypothetical protein